MKRFISFIVCLALTATLAMPALAVEIPSGDIEQILSCMGIMTYNSSGSFNAGLPLTRAQLAKVLVTASSYKGLVATGSRISPFPDVSFTHWGAPYISVAASKGIMLGYSNGTFKPDQNVYYEEAISATLKVLGYTNSDFIGGYPYGQLAAAADIGLTDGVSGRVGSVITRGNMAQLIYNALCAKPKGSTGKTYAETLGYTITGGILTLNDVINTSVKGPVTVKSSNILSAVGLNNPKVYIDGRAEPASQVSIYDVLYYSVSGNTAWVYTGKLTGVIESVSPNREAPTSVVISGKTYALTTYTAQRVFGLDGIQTGKMVTALLDRNGQICDAYLTEALYSQQLGIVTAAGTKQMPTDSGSQSGYYITVLMMDGNQTDISMSYDATGLVGHAVTIKYSDGAVQVSPSIAGSKVSGYVSAPLYTIGGRNVSKDIKIIDMDDYGNFVQITLDRLDGVNLSSSSILLQSVNSSGAVDGMIIKNATGDTAKYGVVTSVTKNNSTSSINISSSYTFDIAGVPGSYSSNNSVLNVSTGPSVFYYKSGKVASIKNLTALNKAVTFINPSYLQSSDGQKYKLAPNVSVYKFLNSKPVLSSLSDAMSGNHTISAYYDKAQGLGGLIRVIYVR